MDFRRLSAPSDKVDRKDEKFARRAKEKTVGKAKRKKSGGRKKGSINKKTIEKLALAEREVAAASKGAKFAVDHMDEMIVFFRAIIGKLVPWKPDGTPLPGRDHHVWFRCVDAFQGFLAMRAPYQSARLSAVAIMPQQAQQRTTVNVTILNERGEKVYSDSADSSDDAKVIEHMPADGEAA
jgi:hypothetical protein